MNEWKKIDIDYGLCKVCEVPTSHECCGCLNWICPRCLAWHKCQPSTQLKGEKPTMKLEASEGMQMLIPEVEGLKFLTIFSLSDDNKIEWRTVGSRCPVKRPTLYPYEERQIAVLTAVARGLRVDCQVMVLEATQVFDAVGLPKAVGERD